MDEPFHEREADIINPDTEMHYAILSSFQNTKFPHSHDFYEFSLILDGTQSLEVNGNLLELPACSLVLIRPNDVHARKYLVPGSHVNIAFSSKIARAMFDYLGDGYPVGKLLDPSQPPCLVLSSSECGEVHASMDELYAIQMRDVPLQRTKLRTLILELFVHYLSRCFHPQVCAQTWLDRTLQEMGKPPNLIRGIPALIEISQKSHEHLCRVFRQSLGCTPTEYVNDLRLNYAANFLRYSDLKIIDICLNAGFDNVSHFYHLFQQKYHMPPKKFLQIYRSSGSLHPLPPDEP